MEEGTPVAHPSGGVLSVLVEQRLPVQGDPEDWEVLTVLDVLVGNRRGGCICR